MNGTLAPDTALTASDRCDRCGARAYLRVRMPGGGELLFCAHHAAKHEESLRKVAVEILDERERLADAPASAAPESEN